MVLPAQCLSPLSPRSVGEGGMKDRGGVWFSPRSVSLSPLPKQRLSPLSPRSVGEGPGVRASAQLRATTNLDK